MAGLVIVDDPAFGPLRFLTVSLSDADIGGLCGDARPAAALAALLRTLDGAEIAERVIDAVAARTAWRLRGKNRRYGHAGLKIAFTLDMSIAAVERARSYALATCRIRAPDWRGPGGTSPAIVGLILGRSGRWDGGGAASHFAPPPDVRRAFAP